MLPIEPLTGHQIYLKELLPTDVTEQYIQWLNDPSINQFLESRHQIQTIQSCQNFINELKKQGNSYFWGIYCKETDQHIGNIKLGPVNPIYQRAAIGLLIGNKTFWSKGIATEAIQLVTQFALQTLKLHKVDAGCYATNLGSKKAFLNCGYQVEGILKEHFYYQNKFEDYTLLGKVKNRKEQ